MISNDIILWMLRRSAFFFLVNQLFLELIYYSKFTTAVFIFFFSIFAKRKKKAIKNDLAMSFSYIYMCEVILRTLTPHVYIIST